VAAIATVLVLALLIAVWDIFSSRTSAVALPPREKSGQAADVKVKTNIQQPKDAVVSSDGENDLVSDDGQTLWASPTAGEPLDLSYLPPGVQMIVAMRPEAIVEHPEGKKVLAALGPLGMRGIESLDEILRIPAGIEQCLIGIQPAAAGGWQTTIVVRLTGGHTAAEHLADRFKDAVQKSHGATTYQLADEWAYWAPDAKDATILIAASPQSIVEIIDLAGAPPPLRREVERLVQHSDAERHFTAIVAPNFLFSEGAGLFSDVMAPFRQPLFWFLGDELSAAAVSLHWDENFFVELIAAPTLDTRPEAAARILATRVAEIPDRLEDYVIGLDAHPFARRVVARFPTMVRKLAAYSRSGVEQDHAVLRCYLPAVAGHNLIMGAELTLSESMRKSRAAVPVASTVISDARAAPSVGDKLRQKVSLAFARDTLESAIEQLSKDIDVEIEILGADLQAEGITKNQSFGIEMSEKPAEEILVAILRLANPDKTATGPGDARQKLVYVIAPAEGDRPERITITTRSQAAERDDELPAVFRDARK
jgi:hypothetical protein